MVLSRAPAGLAAPLVRVEVHLGSGLPALVLVGLPEAATTSQTPRSMATGVLRRCCVPIYRICRRRWR
jgi:magnesium chelatase family protein